MKKEYRYNIAPTASGDMWSVEVLHDGRFVSDMRRSFNHIYQGKAPNRKIVKLSKEQAKEYIAQLENDGYTKINKF